MYRVVYSTGDPPMMGTKIVPAKNRDDAMNTVRNVLKNTSRTHIFIRSCSDALPESELPLSYQGKHHG
jgi:hypothetical protein